MRRADLVTCREYHKGHAMIGTPEEVRDLMVFMAKHLTIKAPLQVC